MPIETKRVEAAIEAANEIIIDGAPVKDFVEAVLAAAWPELASDPPTAWVAPWEATEAMGHEMFMQGEDVWEMWRCARDAHTKGHG
jgi:hypothetical protein